MQENPDPKPTPTPKPKPKPDRNQVGQVHAPRDEGRPEHGLCLHHRRGAKVGRAAWLKCTPGSAPRQSGPRASSGRSTWRLWLARRSHGRGRSTGRLAIASGIRASRPQSRPFPLFGPAGRGGLEAGRRRARRAKLAPATGSPSQSTEAPQSRLLPVHVSHRIKGGVGCMTPRKLLDPTPALSRLVSL
jgi:hypothetical protein